MQVFEEQEYRMSIGQSLKLADQRAQCPLLSLLRGHVGRGIAVVVRDRQQRADQRDAVLQIVGALSEQRLQLGQFGRRVIGGRETRRPLQLLHYGA